MPDDIPATRSDEQVPSLTEAQAFSTALQKVADRPHHWTMLFSVLAIVMSVASALVAWRSSNFAEKQYEFALAVRDDAKAAAKKQFDDIERSRRAAEASAAAASATVGVAKQQLETTVDHFHLEQRAYLELAGVSRLSELQADKPIVFEVGLRNSGKTAALRAEVRMWVSKSATFEGKYPPATEAHEPFSITDVGIGAERKAYNSITLKQEDIDQVKTNQARIYVYGWVKYVDKFSPEKVRLTKFCYLYPVSVGMLNTNRMMACAVHNSSN